MSKVMDNIVGLRDMTPEEQAWYDAQEKEWLDGKVQRKLDRIKRLRLDRLIETDYLALPDVTMPEYIKTWRQTLRDIPQNNTTEEEYDTLLEIVKENNIKKYKHSIWVKPTS